MSTEAEFEAMRDVQAALDKLPQHAAERVLHWVASRLAERSREETLKQVKEAFGPPQPERKGPFS